MDQRLQRGVEKFRHIKWGTEKVRVTVRHGHPFWA